MQKKKKSLKFSVLFGITVLVTLLVKISEVSADTLTVSSGSPYKSISAAIAASKPGDVVWVMPGRYQEKGLTIDKSISLIGKGWPLVDGEGKYEMLDIKADGVTVQGLRFENSGYTSIKDIAAIKLFGTRDCRIIGNQFRNNYFGIYLSGVHSCLVQDNVITGNNTRETNSGNGIHLWKSDSCRILQNQVQGHRDGIYFEFVKNSYIAHNLSTACLRYGLHFMFSDGNVYEYNTFRNNGAGVAVMYTRHIVMRYNHFESNWGSAAYGLLLKEINNSRIEHNSFTNNTTGIFMESSSSLGIRENLFQGNGWAMKILANCMDDTLANNNFISNTFDVSTNGTLNGNHFTGNYWDKYQGYDLDKNGIGDVPYRPVSLFSMVMEQIPNSVMLLRSMVSDILDAVERLDPSVIPPSLMDESPSMKPLALQIAGKPDALPKGKTTQKQPQQKRKIALAEISWAMLRSKELKAEEA